MKSKTKEKWELTALWLFVSIVFIICSFVLVDSLLLGHHLNYCYSQNFICNDYLGLFVVVAVIMGIQCIWDDKK